MEHFKDQIHSEFVECYPEAQNMALHDYNELLAEYLIDKLRNIEMERNNTFLRKLKRIISGWFVKKNRTTGWWNCDFRSWQVVFQVSGKAE